MCLAIYRPEGKEVSIGNLKRGWESNDDGAGYCFIDEHGEIVIKKFMDWTSFINEYTPDVEKYGDASPFLIHFRITSKGATSIDNCHPFRVNNDMAIIHNGTMSNIDIPKGDTRSDTKIFAEEYLAGIGEVILDNIFVFELAEGFIGYSKVCILHRTRGVFILNEDLGHWHEGCWYSNKSYEPKKYYTAVKPVTNYGYSDGYSDEYKQGWEYYYGSKGIDTKKEEIIVFGEKCDWCHTTDNVSVTVVTDVLGYETALCSCCFEEYTELYSEVLCDSCGESAFTRTYCNDGDQSELYTLCPRCLEEWEESEYVNLVACGGA